MSNESSSGVSFIGFCTHVPGMKHFVHFLPIDSGKTNIAPLQTTIKLFVSHAVQDEMTFGGARLGHPDGVRLFDAFPLWYDETKKLWGIKVTIAPERGQSVLTDSKCIFEFSSQPRSMRYFGVMDCGQTTKLESEMKATVSVIQDLSLVPSIVVVNSGVTPFSPHYVWSDTQSPVLLEAIAPLTVREVPLELAHGREPVAPVELSWGRVYIRLLEPVGEQAPSGCATFLVHRLATESGEQGRIVSVVPLGGGHA